ncbi:MAG: SH3 domain-containing protein [Candidatus Aminicenantes bacterium]|nr:SH3 domain-containing protein [Candidatus Aminicenantes bacterium]
MKKNSRFKLLLCTVLVVFVVVLVAETLIVKVQVTNLRKEPKFYSPALAVLKAGENVEKISSQAGWYKVRTSKGLEGWVHSSAVKTKKFTLLAMDKSLKTQATADEVALAGKGFNKQVEEKYKAKHSEINFAWVDRMLKIKVTPKQLEKFLRDGKLGEFGGEQ